MYIFTEPTIVNSIISQFLLLLPRSSDVTLLRCTAVMRQGPSASVFGIGFFCPSFPLVGDLPTKAKEHPLPCLNLELSLLGGLPTMAVELHLSWLCLPPPSQPLGESSLLFRLLRR